MKFPELTSEKEKLAGRFAAETSHPINNIRIIASPYRIAPIGAHIDHHRIQLAGIRMPGSRAIAIWVPGGCVRRTACRGAQRSV